MEMAAGRPTLSFTFLELLDRTFRIYRENFLTLIGLVTLVTIPLTIINFILNYPSLTALNTPAFTRNAVAAQQSAVCMAGLVSIVAGVVQFVLINAPITYIASENQFGRRVSIGEAFNATRHRYSKLAFGLIMLAVVLIVFIFAVSLISAVCPIALVTVGIVAYIFIATYSFLAPVLTLEDVGTSFGINRAWSLGKARFWMVLAVSAALGLISFIITLAFTAAAQWVILQVIPPTTSFATAQIVDTALSTFISIFIVPLLPIGLTLLYYDTRTRIEGLDLALQSLDRPDARPWNVTSPAGGAGLNSTDWRNIVLFSIGAVIIFVAFSATIVALLSPYLPVGGFPAPR